MRKLFVISAIVPVLCMANELSASHLNVKIRLQPRIDLGDLYIKEGSLKTAGDFYFRRIRLEVSRKWNNIPLGEGVKLNITFQSDKGDRDYDYKKTKKSRSAFKVKLKFAYIDWKLNDMFVLSFGKRKMPYSRISLTSSSRQLFIERPYSTEDAKKWLGDYDANQIMLHGKIGGGILKYTASVSDGGFIEEKQKAGDAVRSNVGLGNFYAFRIEFSPPGFIEGKKDDTGIGEKNKGNIISLGFSYSKNRNFDVDTNNDTADGYEIIGEEGAVLGIDLFGRFFFGPGVLTTQAEYVSMEYDKLGKKEKGWYVQSGYLFNTGIGKFEPALRYERVDYGNNNRRIITAGINHYIKSHRIKWAYNLVKIDDSELYPDQTIHQVQAQFYF